MGDKEIVTMSMREVDRLKVIREVLEGRLKRREAARQLHLSKRQLIRLCKRVHREGTVGIIHRLRGKTSNHKLDSTLIGRAIDLVEKEYPDFGPTFANEMLSERHGIAMSVTALRSAMISEGLWKANKQKARYRKNRERRACVGELVQLDGSHHDWFEGRAAKCVLIAFIDDATSRILYAEFVDSEDTINLMRTTRTYLQKYGRPVAFYVDKDSIFRINRQATIEEQLRDSEPLTQYARAMEELNIAVIFANTPQAKGRVERSFKTHQDRLVKYLRINGISDSRQANDFLWKIYIPKHNARFAVQPANSTDTHRPLQQDHRLDEILSLRTQRTLANDYTIRFNNSFFQVLLQEELLLRPRNKVLVEVRLDQSIHLKFQNTYLNYTLINKPARITSHVPECLIKKKPKPPVPAKDHPWRSFRFGKNAINEKTELGATRES